MLLIDTSIWLFALRKDYHFRIKERVENLLLKSEIAVNGIIKLELLGGTATRKDYERLKCRLDSLYYIESTHELWDHAAGLAFNLRRKGITVPYTDILIAASAILCNALLLHADAHFDLIAKHSDLKVESFVNLIKGGS